MHRVLFVSAAVLVFVLAFTLATVAWADTPSSCGRVEEVHLEVTGLG